MDNWTHLSFGIFFAIVGYLLIGASQGVAGFDVVLWTCLFSIAPNIDTHIFKIRRSFATHSLFTVLAVFLALYTLSALVPDGEGLPYSLIGLSGALYASLGVLSHLFADSLTTSGVPILYPLHKRRHTLMPIVGPRLRFPDNYKNNYLQFFSIVAFILLLVLDIFRNYVN